VIYAPVSLKNHLDTPGRISSEKLREELNAYLTDLEYGAVALDALKNEVEKVRTHFVSLGLIDVNRVFASGKYELPNPETVELIDFSQFEVARKQGQLNGDFLNLKMATAYAIRDLQAIKAHNLEFRQKIEDALREGA
jgi:hypothetical protein